MTWISLIVPKGPFGKQRAMPVGRGNFIDMVTPLSTVRYEDFIRELYIQKYGYAMSFKKDEPIEAIIHYWWPHTKVLRPIFYGTPVVKKPDIDNCEKLTYDGLNQLAWPDDAQIVSCRHIKRYCRTEIEVPRVEIILRTWKTEYENLYLENPVFL